MPFAPLPFIAGLSHNGISYMGVQWCLGFALISLFIAFKVWERAGILPASLFSYLSLSSIYKIGVPDPLMAANPQLQMSLTTGALSALVFMLGFVFFFLYFNSLEDAAIRRMLNWSTVANSIYVIVGAIGGWGRLSQGVGVSGFLDYSGMNACLVAIGIPFIGGSPLLKVAFYSLALVAIILSKSSIPYGVLVVVVVSYIISRFTVIDVFGDLLSRTRKTAQLLWGCLTGLAITTVLVGAAYMIEGNRLFDSAKRFEAYRLFFLAWKKDGNLLWGTGPGSFQMLAPIVQMKNNFMVDLTMTHSSYFWLWAHSDWLQSFLENGAIGVILAIVVYVVALLKLYQKDDYQVFAMFSGLGASAIFDYPLRIFIFSFLSVYALARAYQCDSR